MTWFKVDDTFYRSRKVRLLGRDRVACVGLWTLCGGWSADNLTDGFVPWEVVDEWDSGRKRTRVLLKVGLWEEGRSDGEEGVFFHDWADWQPTRDQVMARRKADADRRARWRNAKKHGRPPDSDPEGEQPESCGESRRDTQRESRNGSRVGSVLPDPTRPDPTRSTACRDLGRGAAEPNARTRAAPRQLPLAAVVPSPPARCPRHAALPAGQPVPACGACADLRRAAEHEQATAEDARAADRHARRTAIDACAWCDDTGHRELDTGAVRRCDHTRPLEIAT